jgi:hypothetical protein
MPKMCVIVCSRSTGAAWLGVVISRVKFKGRYQALKVDSLPGNDIALFWYEGVFRSSERVVHLQRRDEVEVGQGVGRWSRLLPMRLRVRCGGHDAIPSWNAGDLCLGQSWAKTVQMKACLAGELCLQQVGHGMKGCGSERWLSSKAL